MAWRTTKVEDQRLDFINDFLKNESSVTYLCQQFCISRKTAYKWISRYQEEGLEGLKDLNRSRHTQNNKTSEDVISIILETKYKYLKWGPKKINAFLQHNLPNCDWPSSTTIGKILEKNGLTCSRKLRKRFPSKNDPLSHCKNPNDLWCIDFKGWFKTKDNVRCDPITLTDAHSRYILHCSKLSLNTVDNVWNVLSNAFYEYGLPLFLRHDNGPPFATSGAGRLSRLSVNLIKAGVIPEWIDPGKPYQNGRHERMHLTLKEEGVFPNLTLKEQQLKFKDFQKYYNFERPHEALGQKTPSTLYIPSNREWKGKLYSPEYSQEFDIKRVRAGGVMAWNGRDIFIGKTLSNEYVGIKENEEGEREIFYGPVFLGIINNEIKLNTFPIKNRKQTNYKSVVY
jgi:putative transposase